MIETYERIREAYSVAARDKRTETDASEWIKNYSEFSDPTRVSWTSTLRQSLARNTRLDPSSGSVRSSMYRPFSKQQNYFDRYLNHRRGLLPSMFPTPNHSNLGIYVPAPGSGSYFSALATEMRPDLCLLSASGQFFSRYTYEPMNDADQLKLGSADDLTVEGFKRVDNISADALNRYQAAFGPGVTKDDIFASIYAVLHSPQYRDTAAVWFCETGFKEHSQT